MKKFIRSISLISLISLFSCATPITNQTTEVWSGERSGESSVLTLSKINDNYYTFTEDVQSKNGELIKIAGTITFDKGDAQFRYTKPGNSLVIASREIIDDGKTYIYTIKNSDTDLSKAGSKYTYIKR